MEKKVIKVKRPASWLEREEQLRKIKHQFKNRTLLAITKQTIYYLPGKVPTKAQKHMIRIMLWSRLGTFLKTLGVTLLIMLGAFTICGAINSSNGDCTVGMLKIIDLTIPVWLTCFVLIAIGLVLEKGLQSRFEKWLKN